MCRAGYSCARGLCCGVVLMVWALTVLLGALVGALRVVAQDEL